MELWIVRHGETVDNINHVLQGQQPGKLSELGIAQAKQTGVELSKQKFSEIYCSDLGRTKETLKHILESFPDENSIKTNYCPLIREKGFGILEGLPREVYQGIVKKSGIHIRDYKPEGGESWHDVHRRAIEFLDLLNSRFIRPEVFTGKDIDPSIRLQNGSTNLNIKEPVKDIQEERKEGALKKESDFMGNNKIQNDTELPKILVISHRGYMTELFNVINFIINKDNFVTLGDLGNCSIHILRVIPGKGISQDMEDIQYEFLKRNDISHLKSEN